MRLELAGGLYHVTSRGDRRENIYLDDNDRNKWLKLFSHVCEQYNWRCHAYCLMSNHYHLMIETVKGNLSKVKMWDQTWNGMGDVRQNIS